MAKLDPKLELARLSVETSMNRLLLQQMAMPKALRVEIPRHQSYKNLPKMSESTTLGSIKRNDIQFKEKIREKAFCKEMKILTGNY